MSEAGVRAAVSQAGVLPSVATPGPRADATAGLARGGEQASFQDVPPLEPPGGRTYGPVESRLVIEIDPWLQWFFNIPARL